MSNQARRFCGRTLLTGPYQLRPVLASAMLAGGILVAACSSAPATATPSPTATATPRSAATDPAAKPAAVSASSPVVQLVVLPTC
jgi:hypothetical protein